MVVDARKLFTPEDKERFRQALAQVESGTSAEIVCAVATESGRYDRAECHIGVLLSLLGLGLLHSLHYGGAGSFGSATPLSLWSLMLTVALTYLLGIGLASNFPSLRTRLINRKEMEEETIKAAMSVFTSRRVASTSARGGLLIYLSLFERRVVVLADHGALEALGKEGILTIRQKAVEHLRQGQALEALLAGLEAAGAIFREKLPCQQGGGENELSDELQILHPRP